MTGVQTCALPILGGGWAAAQFGCEPDAVRFAQGKVFAETAPDQAVAFGRLAGTAHWSPGQLPEGLEPGLRETVFWTPQPLAAPTERDEINTSAAYGFAFDLCAVEVDRITGRVRIDRYVTCHDAGRPKATARDRKSVV